MSIAIKTSEGVKCVDASWGLATWGWGEEKLAVSDREEEGMDVTRTKAYSQTMHDRCFPRSLSSSHRCPKHPQS
jgi:hypothetical protein